MMLLVLALLLRASEIFSLDMDYVPYTCQYREAQPFESSLIVCWPNDGFTGKSQGVVRFTIMTEAEYQALPE